MPAVVVRDMSVEMHRRLKSAALQHHRSMNREVLMILEQTLEPPRVAELAPPLKSLRPISGDTIVRIIRNMRDRGR
jgi:plasmid stability protein